MPIHLFTVISFWRNYLKYSILGGALKGIILTNIQRTCKINGHVVNDSVLNGNRTPKDVLYGICSMVLNNNKTGKRNVI